MSEFRGVNISNCLEAHENNFDDQTRN